MLSSSYTSRHFITDPHHVGSWLCVCFTYSSTFQLSRRLTPCASYDTSTPRNTTRLEWTQYSHLLLASISEDLRQGRIWNAAAFQLGYQSSAASTSRPTSNVSAHSHQLPRRGINCRSVRVHLDHRLSDCRLRWSQRPTYTRSKSTTTWIQAVLLRLPQSAIYMCSLPAFWQSLTSPRTTAT